MATKGRDRAQDGLLTLLGDLPELVRNLITAEVNAAKAWVRRSSKDAGWGGLWFLVALFFLFWAIPVLLVFAIAGLSSWWPVWLSALVVFGGLFLVTAWFIVMGWRRFKRLTADNPVKAVGEDIRMVREVGEDEF
jgi:protein-S-isoprenylcysteine O-methyltransferase Ste14